MNSTLIKSKVVGVSFNERKAYVKDLSIGDPLILVREPDNQHDQNAIKVITIENMQLGYIRARLASDLAPLYG